MLLLSTLIRGALVRCQDRLRLVVLEVGPKEDKQALVPMQVALAAQVAANAVSPFEARPLNT